MERLGGSRYRLSTGREIDANKGIIGLSEEPYEPQVGPFSLYEGYDGPLAGYLSGKDDSGYPQDWTPEELVELAEFMIAQWQRFKDAADPAVHRHELTEAETSSDFALAPPEQRTYSYNGRPSSPEEFAEIFRRAMRDDPPPVASEEIEPTHRGFAIINGQRTDFWEVPAGVRIAAIESTRKWSSRITLTEFHAKGDDGVMRGIVFDPPLTVDASDVTYGPDYILIQGVRYALIEADRTNTPTT